MVIIFSNPLARNQLLTKGKVYTFRRGKLRKKLRSDWAAARRGGHKIADVIINPIIHVKPNRFSGALRPLVDYSGFDSVREWLEARAQSIPAMGLRHIWDAHGPSHGPAANTYSGQADAAVLPGFQNAVR